MNTQTEPLSDEQRRKILIIEDDEKLLMTFEARLKNEAIILVARCVREVYAAFDLHGATVAVAGVDALIPLDLGENVPPEPPTPAIVREVRKKYGDEIYMIAASSIPEYSDLLLEAGCNEKCTKGELPERIKFRLTILSKAATASDPSP